MNNEKEYIISDLSIAEPSEALTDYPKVDHWHVMSYEGDEISGKMIWAPARNKPQDVSIPLPSLGTCKVYIGLYASGTVPFWFNLLRPPKGSTPATTVTCHRLMLRLSDDDWFDTIVPEDFHPEPRFTHIAEGYWKTADIKGQSLILAAPASKKEAMLEISVLVAYIRLVPTEKEEPWPKNTKRMVYYNDGMMDGHYVDSVQDVRSHLMPLKDSDVDTVLWNTSREDSCYYPTKVGNKITDIGARIGIYPYWTATDIQKMLDHGDDPLTAVCDVGHECGLKVYASYRRMTFRMPPFVFPLHPNAFLIKHPECRCVDRDGEAVPHLSMAYPEVRQLMIDIFVEQAENYDIDGVHMYFCRGVPFIYFEGSFVDAFVKEYNCDPRALPVDDERVWKVRAKFFLTYMRDLRAALDRVGEARGKRVDIALNVMNSPRVCMYFGMDIKALAEEKLVDLLMPAQAHFFPREELGEWHLLPEFVAEFVKIAKPHGIQVRPECGTQYWDDNRTIAQLAKEYYDVGADGIQAGVRRETCSGYEGGRRLGHVDQLDQFNSWVAGARRMVKVKKVAGLTFDTISGVVTCG